MRRRIIPPWLSTLASFGMLGSVLLMGVSWVSLTKSLVRADAALQDCKRRSAQELEPLRRQVARDEARRQKLAEIRRRDLWPMSAVGALPIGLCDARRNLTLAKSRLCNAQYELDHDSPAVQICRYDLMIEDGAWMECKMNEREALEP